MLVSSLSYYLIIASSFGKVLSSSNVFNPRSYEMHKATCPAVKRSTEPYEDVNIDISYVDSNPSKSKETVIMVHGWPSLWSSWSNQILEFETTHRVIVLDQRGFGSSTHPDDVENSGNMPDLVGDLVCVLDAAGVAGEVMCMGHDWGTQVCYEAARMRPDMFTSVVGIAIPYIPYAADFVETAALTPILPKLSYQLFFEKRTQEAVDELDKDKRRTLRGTWRDNKTPPPDIFLRSNSTFIGGWDGVTEIPPIELFTREEEDYLVEHYEIQGFKNTLQFYTRGNRYASWKFAQGQGNFTIPARSLSILPLNDPVADWLHAAALLGSAKFIRDLITETVEAAHWLQLEQPNIVNQCIRRWIAKEVQTESTRDEL